MSRPRDASRRLGHWLTAAGVLAVLSLALSWGPTAGTAAPSRVAITAGIALVVAGVAGRRDRLLPAAALVGVIGVLLGGLFPSPGRLALAAAVVCLVAGMRAAGRPVFPGR